MDMDKKTDSENANVTQDNGVTFRPEAKHLWADLAIHKNVICGFPWILMGDFNVALNIEDYFSAPSCLHYTWNQKPRSGGGVLKNLDRIMGNLKFVDTFPGAYDIFHRHYHQFLGVSVECDDLNTVDLCPKCITSETSMNMVHNITNKEIKTAMFNIGDDRAPGPDGFTSAFFKKSWNIVGNDVCSAVREFFDNGQLLKEVNHNELMHNYHRNRGPPRCAFKVDIQKPYDTVDWKFLDYILRCYGFHHKMVKWIMTCVMMASFSICINGDIHGFFKGKRGLRQGDPLSPYLFTLVMECCLICVTKRAGGSGQMRGRLLKALNIMCLIPVQNLVDDRLDETQWRDTNGFFFSFSVRNAWEALRPLGIEVSWWKVVWFSHNIPRHSFHMWLVMRNSLKTHDRIRQWDVGPNVDIISLRWFLFCMASSGSVNDGVKLTSCLKSGQIRDIDGRILGKDGKPMRRAIRVKIGETTVREHQIEEPITDNPYEGLQTPRGWEDPKINAMQTEGSQRTFFVMVGLSLVHRMSAVKHKFANSLVGFFVGKKVAFPLVKTRNIPLMLTKWSPNMVLSKDKVTRVPVWVKLHKVPVVAYSEDGLSLIATQIGNPIMLDAYTSSMCADEWGRMGYARALVEVCAEKELKKEVVMAIPNIEDEKQTHTLKTIQVDYEWKPPQCLECQVFGHNNEQCPKRITEKSVPVQEINDDGFIKVVNRKTKGKGPVNSQHNYGGFKVNNSNKNLVWEPVKHRKSVPVQEINDDGFIKVVNRKTKGKGPVNSQHNYGGFKVNNSNKNLVWEPVKHRKNSTIDTDKKTDSENANVFLFWSTMAFEGVLLVRTHIGCVYVAVDASWHHFGGGCGFEGEWEVMYSIIFLVYADVGVVDGGGECWVGLGFACRICVTWPRVVVVNLNGKWSCLVVKDHLPCEADGVSLDLVADFCSYRFTYTWNQKPRSGGGVLKKLDRIMRNLKFADTLFPERMSKFNDIVAEQWLMSVDGYLMYRVVTKMKALKKPLRKLLQSHGNLHDRVNSLRTELDEIDEEWFLKQKAKIEWLDVGDSNSSYFHKSVKCKNQRSRIDSIRDNEDNEVTSLHVAKLLLIKALPPFSFLGLVGIPLFNIGDDRAPGLDGFASVFFKKSWNIVGNDVCSAVREFFDNGQLLKEVNHTFLALIPKVSTPLKVTDYRPISCCNVLYKCISKIITNRIIDGLKEIVSENQSAFIPGRRISDNILITQELMHNYHRNRGPPRCAFKVDIQKAYDTVDWKFLDYILRWKRELRQGDVDSARLIMEALGEFQNCSGLVPSIPKSKVYFCNVQNQIKTEILGIMPFTQGELPVKYLGVPLISSRLFNRDCKILVEKVVNKVGDWKNKSLSYAGRLQLCRSVLSSMHVYWAVVLVIPISIIHDIEQLMRGFLWCNGDLKRGKAKVAWEDICLPKSEGGLGIRSLEIFNIALMTTHIWNIVTNKESLWVKWVHMYKLKGRTIWDIPVRADMSWGWQKLLQIQEVVKPFFWKILGNGYNLKTCVADMVTNEGWKCPHVWLLKAPNINLILEALRPRGFEVSWWKVVWFSHNIPRHSFHMWLVMKNSLKTHDRIRQWDVGPNVDIISLRCKFYDSLAGMDTILPILQNIITYLQPMAHQRNIKSVIGRLLIAAASYCIWMERNCRTFKNVRRTPEEVRDSIITIVRLKLLTCRFKNTTMVNELLARWK
ncbi:hypothetical protein Tco_0065613 [Tanacetum coccineum]